METSKINIEIATGILGIDFGMTRRQVRKVLGRPNEKDYLPAENPEDGVTEVWHYDDLEMSVTFDETENWKLTTFAVSSPDFLFEGVNLIGLSVEEVMEQIDFMDLGDMIIMDVNDEDDDIDVETQVGTIFHSGVNLWFVNGITTEIQWGKIWEEEYEIEKPPKKKKKKEKIDPEEASWSDEQRDWYKSYGTPLVKLE